MLRLVAAVLMTSILWPLAAMAQGETPPSKCVAIAQALPSATYANFTPAQVFVDGDVTITYAGHSTYIIETPGRGQDRHGFFRRLWQRSAAARRHHEQGAPDAFFGRA